MATVLAFQASFVRHSELVSPKTLHEPHLLVEEVMCTARIIHQRRLPITIHVMFAMADVPDVYHGRLES